MEMNGIAHLQLTVTHFKACVEFYRPLLAFFEMQTLIDTDFMYYAIGSRTGLSISPCDEVYADERFQQRRVGLHHLCFRARLREDVDEVYAFVQTINACIVHPPQEDAYAPGYYSVLFEDPDGIRIEVNHVPGKGHMK